jgi:hypothetical protein
VLWYKSWLETRWRFLIGLALLICAAAGNVLFYPQVVKLAADLPTLDAGSELGRRIAEAAHLMRDYRGYIWVQWFKQNMLQMWTVFAVLLGTGGLLAQTSGGAALYTLSLPISRGQLTTVRAATGLLELVALALVPSLAISLLSPAVGERYPVGEALIHAIYLVTGGAVFFSLAFLLSTVFSDIWRPLMIALFIAALLAVHELVVPDAARYSVFRVMSGEQYFLTGDLPWKGLLVSLAFSAVMLYLANISIARRDF